MSVVGAARKSVACFSSNACALSVRVGSYGQHEAPFDKSTVDTSNSSFREITQRTGRLLRSLATLWGGVRVGTFQHN